MRTLSGFGAELQRARHLAGVYEAALMTRRLDEATRVSKEIYEILAARTRVDSLAVRRYAYELSGHNRHLEAVLFFLVASEFYARESNPNVTVCGLKSCCWGLREVNAAIMKVGGEV